MSSPTQRSLAYLRNQGWTVCIVEKWVPQRHIRIDAFGFGDLLACKPQGDGGPFGAIALVQTTSGSNLSARRDKIRALLNTPDSAAGAWKAADGLILLHGWRKVGPRGKRKLWQVIEERL